MGHGDLWINLPYLSSVFRGKGILTYSVRMLCGLSDRQRRSGRYAFEKGRKKDFAPALTKAGGNFTKLRSSFDVYDPLHRTMPTTPQGGISAEPCAMERHSSESGSYEAGEIKTYQLNTKKVAKFAESYGNMPFFNDYFRGVL